MAEVGENRALNLDQSGTMDGSGSAKSLERILKGSWKDLVRILKESWKNLEPVAENGSGRTKQKRKQCNVTVSIQLIDGASFRLPFFHLHFRFSLSLLADGLVAPPPLLNIWMLINSRWRSNESTAALQIFHASVTSSADLTWPVTSHLHAGVDPHPWSSLSSDSGRKFRPEWCRKSWLQTWFASLRC